MLVRVLLEADTKTGLDMQEIRKGNANGGGGERAGGSEEN